MQTGDWVTAALTDDALVVELLFRLKHSSSESHHPNPPPLTLPVGWGHRQPRSRPPLPPTTTENRKESETTRCSPTTPLSWSGGSGSPSDGCDDSNSVRQSDRFYDGRSKGTFTNEITTTSANKRSRKKKTFAELTEDESLLLKERVHLKKELASLRITLEEQRDRRENLKRMKLDMHLPVSDMEASASDEPELATSSQPPLNHTSVLSTGPTLDSSIVKEDVKTKERCFVIPDLNIMLTEEDSGSEILYGMS